MTPPTDATARGHAEEHAAVRRLATELPEGVA